MDEIRFGRTTASSARARSYKKVVKLTFAKGASLKDPSRLFNSSLDGNMRRAIDIHEGEEVDESARAARGAPRPRYRRCEFD